jgi:hypothetical protein
LKPGTIKRSSPPSEYLLKKYSHELRNVSEKRYKSDLVFSTLSSPRPSIYFRPALVDAICKFIFEGPGIRGLGVFTRWKFENSIPSRVLVS